MEIFLFIKIIKLYVFYWLIMFSCFEITADFLFGRLYVFYEGVVLLVNYQW